MGIIWEDPATHQPKTVPNICRNTKLRLPRSRKEPGLEKQKKHG